MILCESHDPDDEPATSSLFVGYEENLKVGLTKEDDQQKGEEKAGKEGGN